MKNIPTKITTSCLTLAYIPVALFARTPDNTRPNVIVVLTDDQGYGELSVHGNPILRTPNLDAMHSRSIRMTDFHACAMSTPTRGQLMTGIDVIRHGAVNVSSGRTALSTDFPTMADFFRDNGYSTASFGKWHLGDSYPYRPIDRGFDEAVWFLSSHVSSVSDFWVNDYCDDTYYHNGVPEHFDGFCTDVFFRLGMDWMDKQISEKKPFFLYLPTNAAHYPHNAKPEDIQYMREAIEKTEFRDLQKGFKENLCRYLALCKSIDDNMGELFHFLKSRRILDNTIVVFMSDNGTTFGDRYYNAGMRGKKATLYEGGHRVPCFIEWKGGNLVKPCDIDDLTEVQDILPTLLDFCGISYPEDQFDGISLAPALRGKGEIPDRTLFVNFSRMPNNSFYPYADGPTLIRRNQSVVMQGKWRYLPENNELYNIASDPGQTVNVAAEHQDIVERLSKANDEWWETGRGRVNVPMRNVIGHGDQEVALTSCDWLDVFLDMRKQVERGDRKFGRWLLYAEQAGTYTIEVRRWPRDFEHPLSWGDGDRYAALPIKKVEMQLGDEYSTVFEECKVSVDDVCETFTVKIVHPDNPMTLDVLFMDNGRVPVCGAYYCYIKRISD